MRGMEGSGDDAEDVFFFDDGVFLLAEFYLGAAVFADEDHVAHLDFEGDDFAVFVLLAGAQGDDLGLLGLFFGAVRDDNASADLLFFFDVLNENTITDGFDFDVSHMWLVFELEVDVGGLGFRPSAPAGINPAGAHRAESYFFLSSSTTSKSASTTSAFFSVFLAAPSAAGGGASGAGAAAF